MDIITYFTQNLWLIWTLIGVVCLVMELSSGDFYITCFAIGAFLTAIISLFGIPFLGQLLLFAVFSFLSIALIRPQLLKWLHRSGEERPSNADALIGREAVVIEEIRPNESGYVRIDGDEWRSVSTSSSAIAVGEKVKVVARDSIVLTVEKI